MKTPDFWFQPRGWQSRLLTPLTWLWRLGTALRRSSARPEKISVPFILVGNVLAGGVGKTPVVLALAEHLSRHYKVCLIAKGYGGRLEGPLPVDLARHTAADVGDEPLLLATVAPTLIGRDRLDTAKVAALQSDIVISDDGLQNPFLMPDLTFLVMDGVMYMGNGCLIPAGPLREPLAEALKRTDAVIQIGGAPHAYGDTPVLMADVFTAEAEWLKGARIVPFAGLGRPEKFFATCTTSGAQVISTFAYPDHHPYTEAEISNIIRYADENEAIAVTTTKDIVRVPPTLRAQVRVIRTQLVWRDPAALATLLAAHLPPPRSA